MSGFIYFLGASPMAYTRTGFHRLPYLTAWNQVRRYPCDRRQNLGSPEKSWGQLGTIAPFRDPSKPPSHRKDGGHGR